MQLPRQSTFVRVSQFHAQRALVSGHLRSLFDVSDICVYEICRFHMGWIDEAGAPTDEGAGKMIRPLLCLAACSGFGEEERAVGAASALELLHAFSLVHDDIEDGDRERRHRPTVWARYGVPLAINAGDLLFALAHRALYEAIERLPAADALLGCRLFSDTCLRLMEGQHLDLEFEKRASVTREDYVMMVRGKTGAVMGAALGLGALCGGAGGEQVRELVEAGIELGIAFQAVDDLLALWGDPAQTGKAIGNDLERGKKSLPVVLAAERYIPLALSAGTPLPTLRANLEDAGVRGSADDFVAEHRAQAQRHIARAGLRVAGQRRLAELIEFAASRDG